MVQTRSVSPAAIAGLVLIPSRPLVIFPRFHGHGVKQHV